MSWPCMGLLYLQFPIWKLEIDDQSWLSAIDRNWLLTTHERSPGNRATVLFANVARILINAFWFSAVR